MLLTITCITSAKESNAYNSQACYEKRGWNRTENTCALLDPWVL